MIIEPKKRKDYFDRTNFEDIVDDDITELEEAHESYGDSWRKREGIGAFMMLARKWDRLENKVKEHDWDIFEAIEQDPRIEGILDDVKDLRRYLLLVEEFTTCNEGGNHDQEIENMGETIET